MAIKYSTPSTTFLYTALFTIYAPTAIVFVSKLIEIVSNFQLLDDFWHVSYSRGV